MKSASNNPNNPTVSMTAKQITSDESYLHQSQYDYQQKADDTADGHYQDGN
jgi:hypothetical protein